MYDSGRGVLNVPVHDEATAFRLALTRVRKLLGEYLPGMSADSGRLRAALAMPQSDSTAEAERELALGWLAWLEGDWAGAADLLASGGRKPDAALLPSPPEGGEGSGVRGVETTSPPFTPNPSPPQGARGTGSGAYAPRSPLLDPAWLPYWSARVGILQGNATALTDYEAALKGLGGSPQATAWYVDLLCRAGRADRAEQVWKAVRANKRVLGCDEGPLLEARMAIRKGDYPAAERLLLDARPSNGVVGVERHLLLAWILASQRKADQARESLDRAGDGPYPLRALAEWRICIEARLQGTPIQAPTASTAWREYLSGQEARAVGRLEEAFPNYRAALADPAVQPYAAHALASLDGSESRPAPPGAYFATWRRAREAAERFRSREISHVEFTSSLVQAWKAGVEIAAFEGYRRLARQMEERTVALPENGSPVDRRNAVRVALELLAGLDGEKRLALLTTWIPVAETDDLRLAVGRQLLRLAVQMRDQSILDRARPLLPPADVVAADVLFGIDTVATDDSPAVLLWRAADDPESQPLQERSFVGRYRSLRQAILLVHAARRGDLPAVTALLEDADAWRSFRQGPPRFVLVALEALVRGKPTHPGWARVLPRWVSAWDAEALGTSQAVFASVSGAASGETPAGVDPAAWALYQASAAIRRDDAPSAVRFVRRASGSHPILPKLERRAQVAALARGLGYDWSGLLADFVDLLRGLPNGPTILHAAADPKALQEHLTVLLQRPDLPGRLLHHLAIVETRLAQRHEADDPLLATLHARRAWSAWQGYFASAEAPSPEARDLLHDHLLAWHRGRIHDHLSRDELGPARSHWQVVTQLPNLADRVERFRDELASQYLVTTRDGMRFGDVPEGFRANYERGFALLARPLALDPDNARLLTAHVETCVEWFFDLYTLQDARLFTEVDRLLEPAMRLADLVRDQDGHGSARAALSDYWKFRGFAANDSATKATLYREALHFNPGNDNVRDLLARLEGEQ